MHWLQSLLARFMASSEYTPEQLRHASLPIIREIIYRVTALLLPIAVGASMFFSWFNVQRELAIVEGILLTLLIANVVMVLANNSRIFSKLAFCFVIIFFLSAPILLGFHDFIYFCLVYPLVFYVLLSRLEARILNVGWLLACSLFTLFKFPLTELLCYITTHFAILIFTEILFSMLAHNEKELRQLSVRDPLTGAYNRRAMTTYLENAKMTFDRYGTTCSVIMLDLDHFKQINDQHGHKEGDLVLQQITDLLQGRIRGTDHLCRYGGEEFVLILNNTDLDQASTMAELIRQQVKSTIISSKQRITVSCGVAEIKSGETIKDWLHRGDQALYQAKQNGRDRVEADRCSVTAAR